MIFNNPEFIKNVKLEFSVLRFLTPMLLLALFFWIGWDIEEYKRHWQSVYSIEQLHAKSLFSWLCGFGFFFTIVWGTYLTSNNMMEEIKAKTWDFVRMSSLSPFKILTGKMLGVNCVVWLVSLLCVLPSIIYALRVMIPEDGIIRAESITIAVFIGCLICWAILSYSLVFLSVLSPNALNGRAGAFGATLAVLITGTVIGAYLLGGLENFYEISNVRAGSNGLPMPLQSNMVSLVDGVSYMTLPRTTVWYAWEIYQLDYTLMLLGFAAFWCFVGAWRCLRKSLQYFDAPWVWLAFIISTCVFLNGFVDYEMQDLVRTSLVWPLVVTLLLTMLTCVYEASDQLNYKALKQKLSQGQYYEAFRIMPLWILSFSIFIACVLINLFLYGASDRLGIVLLSLTIFMLRDLMAVHIISWKKNIRRPLVGIIIYGLVSYSFLPAIAQNAGAYYFFPQFGLNEAPDFYWLMISIQLAIATVWVSLSWRRVTREL